MMESSNMRWMRAGLVVSLLLTTLFILASLMFVQSSVYHLPKFIDPNFSLLLTTDLDQSVSFVDQPDFCPLNTSTVGRIALDSHELEFEALNRKYSAFFSGGHFKPKNCTSHNKTAIIVAYREREKHLKVLLNNLIPFLIKQQTEFVIFVVELVQPYTFNRALLMNVGFVEALKVMNFTCFFFHDVDLIPVDDRNFYRCSDQPRHMSVGNSKHNYRLLYKGFAGGVLGMSRSTYQTINGHSNLFFGWGGEDDDLVARLRAGKYKIMRHSVVIGRYEALGHKKDKGNPQNPKRMDILKSKRKKTSIPEGLNTLQYKIIKKEDRPLFTWLLVDIDMGYYQTAIDKMLKAAKGKKIQS